VSKNDLETGYGIFELLKYFSQIKLKVSEQTKEHANHGKIMASQKQTLVSQINFHVPESTTGLMEPLSPSGNAHSSMESRQCFICL
jgi:hypothetical protein